MNIDAHIHIWNQSHGEEFIACKAFPSLTGCEFLPDRMADMLQATNSAKAVLVHGPASDRHTDDRLSLAQQDPRILCVIGWLDARAPGAVQRIDALGQHRSFRGVRLTPLLTPDPVAYLQSTQTMEALAHLSRQGHLVEFIVDTALLPDCLSIARALPELSIVIDHCGLPPVRNKDWSPWAEHMQALGATRTVVTKLAGLREQAGGPVHDAQLRAYLRHVVDCFGYAHLVYASNWPVVTAVGGATVWADQLQRLLDDIGMASDEQAAVWGTNATRIYTPRGG